MEYKITMIVEAEEDGNIIFQMDTSAGMAEFEENIVRKAEHAIKEYEARMEYEAQVEMDRQAEELAEQNIN